jgi:hypothetical protein
MATSVPGDACVQFSPNVTFWQYLKMLPLVVTNAQPVFSLVAGTGSTVYVP